MEEDDKGCPIIRMGVSGCMFLLVPAYPGCPGSKAVKRSLLLLLLLYYLHSPSTASGACYRRSACIDMDVLRLAAAAGCDMG